MASGDAIGSGEICGPAGGECCSCGKSGELSGEICGPPGGGPYTRGRSSKSSFPKAAPKLKPGPKPPGVAGWLVRSPAPPMCIFLMRTGEFFRTGEPGDRSSSPAIAGRKCASSVAQPDGSDSVEAR